jgi:hypothetical protein
MDCQVIPVQQQTVHLETLPPWKSDSSTWKAPDHLKKNAQAAKCSLIKLESLQKISVKKIENSVQGENMVLDITIYVFRSLKNID